jgi:hypothetical protein
LFCDISYRTDPDDYYVGFQLLVVVNVKIATIIVFLDISHSPAFYLKHNISETEFCLCLLLQPEWIMSTNTIIVLISYNHKLLDLMKIAVSWDVMTYSLEVGDLLPPSSG